MTLRDAGDPEVDPLASRRPDRVARTAADIAVTGPPWKVGAAPPGTEPREIDAALEAAARPFVRDGYVLTARVPDGLQLERPGRTSILGGILSTIGWFGAALVGFLVPIYVMPSWKAADPIWVWVDRAGDIWAVREQVLRPIDLRP